MLAGVHELCLHLNVAFWFLEGLLLAAAFALFGIVLAGGEGLLRLRSRSAKQKLPNELATKTAKSYN
jgi:hypothetical protein